MHAAASSRTDILLIGGGHAHVEVLRRFALTPAPDIRLTVVSRDVLTPYSGMLPGLTAGHYTREDSHVDLRPLAAAAGARLIHDEVIGLDLAERRALLRRRPAFGFDLVSLDCGSRPDSRSLPGAAEHTLPVKPVDRFLLALERLDDVVARGAALRIVVIGGGAAGVEMTLALQHRWRRLAPVTALSFTLLSDTTEIMSSHPPAVRRRFAATLAERGVAVAAGDAAVAVEANEVRLASGRTLPFEICLLATGAAAPDWPRECGLAVDARGFVTVDATLRSPSHPFVFAVGDVAAFASRGLPKAGVFAVRQGPPLAESLRNVARGWAAVAYRPQRNFLSLVSTGDRQAIAARGALAATARALMPAIWRWKDRIDRRWMAMYRGGMGAPATGDDGAPRAAMQCGGCAAKVGGDVLARALADLRQERRADVLIGLGSASDDAAAIAPPPGMAVVQSVDHFRSFVDDPYLFARIAAVHALNDLYAMGATPAVALANVIVPFGSERAQESDLRQLLGGALSALGEAKVELIGGHTGEGAEMSFGLTVTGYADPATLTRKAGLADGDALVLCKPLGTGALFAADMMGRAKAAWIDAALVSMQRLGAADAAILRAHGARAATDITGFGLVGHLLEMLRASDVDAEIDVETVPALDGALESLAAGIASTLAPQNLKLGRAVADRTERAGRARVALLYDPQTSGGLLAGVPADRVEACVAALRATGAAAARIGTVRAKAGETPALTLLD
jgi:selenide,water dikinase